MAYAFQDLGMGVVKVTPARFEDERGSFTKWYDAGVCARLGLRVDEVMESASRRGVLRGMHFQYGAPQAKLVRVGAGAVFDVALDLRLGAGTFGRWVGATLAAGEALFVPEGFAHGFCVLSEGATVAYLCQGRYEKERDAGVRWDDPEAAIAWPTVGGPFVLSRRDRGFGGLAEVRGRGGIEAGAT